MEKKIKAAMVLRTGSLEYDDRVRKELISIRKMFPNVEIDVYVMLNDNVATEGITSYGLKYQSVYVASRDKYPQGEKAMLKAFDFYRALRKKLKLYDAVWCADIETCFIAMLCKTKHLIWDLHELPLSLTGNVLKKYVLKYIFKRCRVVLHANQSRIDYLESIKALDIKSKHLPLRNFPDFSVMDTEYDSMYIEFDNWLGNRNCVYLQGIGDDSRATNESFDAIMKVPNLCAVVLANISDDVKQYLYKKYGEGEIKSRVFFAGMVNVLKTPQYMKRCVLSLVFYKNTTPNNYYCEANRLYQAVSMDMPVVTGNNPSMKDVVQENHIGVFVDTDGRDENLIYQGILDILSNREEFVESIRKKKELLTWKTQEPILKEAVNKWLK